LPCRRWSSEAGALQKVLHESIQGVDLDEEGKRDAPTGIVCGRWGEQCCSARSREREYEGCLLTSSLMNNTFGQ